MKFKTPSHAAEWSFLLTLILDVMALGALGLTQEVHVLVFCATGAIFLLGKILQITIKPIPLLTLLILTLITAVAFSIFSKIHPILVVANTVPLIHSFLWFGTRENPYQSWRVGLGFVELILCSALTTEFYLPITIILFVITSSITLSCIYLENELKTHAPEMLQEPLPKQFIKRNIQIAILAFMTSLIIFPLLPRGHNSLHSQMNETRIDYTERVNINEWRNQISKQKGAVAIRLYPRTDIELNNEIFPGLLRGRVLEIFDGKSWKAKSEDFRNLSESFYEIKPNEQNKVITVDVIREYINSPVFPVPYGTREVRTQELDGAVITRSYRTGEWIDYSTSEGRAHYFFTLVPNNLSYMNSRKNIDLPKEYHLNLPETVKTERMKKLADEIFSKTKSNREKIYNINSYFSTHGYSATIDYENNALVEASKKTKLSPLEQFLFITKEGHCEFFASSAAILLRMAKVPTRLVSGFRTSKQTNGGVLLVNTTDAHAWVEAWTPELGWYPIDPTPRSIAPFSLFEAFGNTYDLMNAYWYKYIISYSENQGHWLSLSRIKSIRWNDISDKLSTSKESIIVFSSVALLLGGLVLLTIWYWFPWVFSIRWRVREGPFALRKERIRVERWLYSHLKKEVQSPQEAQILYFEKIKPLLRNKISPEKSKKLEEWVNHYRKLRFGPSYGHLDQEIHLLRDKFRDVSH